MSVTGGYRAVVVEHAERVWSFTGLSMFGGAGLHVDVWFFALMAEDPLHFKLNDSGRKPPAQPQA